PQQIGCPYGSPRKEVFNTLCLLNLWDIRDANSCSPRVHFVVRAPQLSHRKVWLSYHSYSLQGEFHTASDRMGVRRSADRSPARNGPVGAASFAATSSGVPSETMRPPAAPPSGPRSMTWSAHLMTSRLCSITTMVLPCSTSLSRTSRSFLVSSKCSPVVG